jgi:hypothetical protein
VFVGTKSFDESEQLIRDLCHAFEVLVSLGGDIAASALRR